MLQGADQTDLRGCPGGVYTSGALANKFSKENALVTGRARLDFG